MAAAPREQLLSRVQVRARQVGWPRAGWARQVHSRAGLAWLLGQQREREKKGWADRRGGELGRPGARAGWNEREKEWARARRGRRRASWAAGRNGGRFGPRGKKRKFSIYEQGKLREIQIYRY